MEVSKIFETPYYAVYRNDAHTILIISFNPVAGDASSDRHPSKTHATIDADGTVNYFEAAPDATKVDWKHKLGESLAVHVVRVEMAAQGLEYGGPYTRCTILDFPEGYALFVQKKGDRHVPRSDAYLYGSRFVHAFRSPAEFFAHAMWIMKGKPMTRNGDPICECCYCGTLPQREIAKKYRLHAVAAGDRGRLDNAARKPRKPRQPSPPIRAKDYTKLNQPS